LPGTAPVELPSAVVFSIRALAFMGRFLPDQYPLLMEALLITFPVLSTTDTLTLQGTA
jgi:hypothetical protein